MLMQLEGTFCFPDVLFGPEGFMGKENKAYNLFRNFNFPELSL